MERIWSVPHLYPANIKSPITTNKNDVKQPLVNDHLPNDHEIYQEYF